MKTKEKKASEGICKLTRRHGRFVKSHIIPAALTKPSRKGSHFLQMGKNERPKRRWSSWYDPELVTDEGEKYLEELDTWAIKILRQNKMVWSGWGGRSALDECLHNTPAPIGIRVVENIDPIKLRLFLLSILWRAAATKLEEFSYVVLPGEHLERLRLMIINGDPEPQSFYPFIFTQLVTRGFVHNHSGVEMELPVEHPDGPNRGTVSIPTYRFYFDGLIVRAYLSFPQTYQVENMKGIIAGTSETLFIGTVPFEDSLQHRSMQEILVS